MINYSTLAEREQVKFSSRLKIALENAGFPELGYLELTREFNIRSGQDPLTVHAVRKWLIGDSIPTQRRLVALARWLRVNPEWLRFGISSVAVPHSQSHGDEDTDLLALISDIASLPPREKLILTEFVQVLLRAQKKLK